MGLSASQVWLFDRRTDLAVFAGTALASAALALAGPWLALDGDTPLWAWLLLVVGIDVAHVWSTLFRVYLDPDELRARPLLYLGLPPLLYALGVAAYQASPLRFWQVLAYLALFHFVRQQAGFVVLYGRKAGASVEERRLDALASYAATLGPVVWWHAHLPRPFWWFVEGDFALRLPSWVGTLALGLDAAALLTWALAQAVRRARGQPLQQGKVLLVLATWLTWFGGIVLARTDFAFTAMNVALHGVPYLVLLYRHARGRGLPSVRYGAAAFLACVLSLALVEELFWDQLVWHERATLFGQSGPLPWVDALLPLLVPLLALPQATHYLLDAFVWRPSRDPGLLARLGPQAAAVRSPREPPPAPSGGR